MRERATLIYGTVLYEYVDKCELSNTFLSRVRVATILGKCVAII